MRTAPRWLWLLAWVAASAAAEELESGETSAPGVFGQSVSMAALASRRGGEADTVFTMEELTDRIEANAQLSDNVARNVTTGANSISKGAFAGAGGFTTAIQNSGNNVIIQDATVVNFTMKP